MTGVESPGAKRAATEQRISENGVRSVESEITAGVAPDATADDRRVFMLKERLMEMELQCREQSEARWTLDLEMRALIEALNEKREYIARLEERIRLHEERGGTVPVAQRSVGYRLLDAAVFRLSRHPLLYRSLRFLARRLNSRIRV